MLKFPIFSLIRFGAACALASALVMAQPVSAQNQTAIPAAAQFVANRSPELSLRAAAASEVRQDTVRISLSAVVDAPDQPAAGKKLTALLDAVVKRARDAKEVSVRTGSFDVWLNDNGGGKAKTSWRGQGQIILESKDFPAIAALASRLSDKTAISGIGFSLSREVREAEERKLLKEAAQIFKDKALAAANAFGFSGYRLIRLELDGAGGVAMPRLMGALAKDKDASGGAVFSADIPLAGADVTVSIAVKGTIALQ